MGLQLCILAIEVIDLNMILLNTYLIRTKLFQLDARETNRSRTNAQSIPVLYIGFLLATLMVALPNYSAQHFFRLCKHDDYIQS